MRLIQLYETDSTNTWLKSNSDGLSHGDAVTAFRQTAGRGRMGHTWLDSDGMLPVSVLLEAPADVSAVTLCAAVAVCRALEHIASEELGIKWPNDIVCRGHKLCGILCESFRKCDRTYIICGFGVNISQPSEYFGSAGIPYGGSLLSVLGVVADRFTLAEDIAKLCAELCMRPFSEVYDEYRRRCVNLGREVRLIQNDMERTAFAEDIAYSGALVCRDDNGSFEVASGEVSVRGLYGYV